MCLVEVKKPSVSFLSTFKLEITDIASVISFFRCKSLLT